MASLLTRLSCALFGHHVDNHVFKRATGESRSCRCGTEYLGEDRSLTRVRHTLSCFLGTHDYEKLAERDGCHEYVCTQCGHPLLFEAGHDPYSGSPAFKKKVRYLCGLFGHRARYVTTRHGFQEYACFCGHSFLKEAQVRGRIRHPAICVATGHRIQYLTRRGGFAEYVCKDCGHPFCFAYNPANPPSRDARRRVSLDDGSSHDAEHLGHVHGPEVHQPVLALVGAAHGVGQQHHAGVRSRVGWRRH